MRYSKLLKVGCIGDYIGYFYRADSEGYQEFNLAHVMMEAEALRQPFVAAGEA